jgi:hypothetical protein
MATAPNAAPRRNELKLRFECRADMRFLLPMKTSAMQVPYPGNRLLLRIVRGVGLASRPALRRDPEERHWV